ncbi:MAG TPA: type II secretion system F family protein [Candidatus Elarobacter sp.]|nr:type II secretion system F family protein [Candidatus Elarobacter sp.]
MPYAIVFGVIAAIGLVLASFWQRITAPMRPMAEEYRLSLEQADVRVRAEEVMLAILGVGIGLWFGLVVFLHLSPLYGALVFPIALTSAAVGAKGWIAQKRRKRLTKFGDQLELVLRLKASGLRAGLGLRQALVLVIDELDDPARTEFMRVLGQANIGQSVYDALDSLAKRMPSEECSMMVRAIRVQSQTGGNLAKVLEHLATTIKERRRVYRKMRALTAEGRMTAWVIALLPVIVGVMIVGLQPSMRHALLQTEIGHVVMIFVFLLEGAGILMLRRMMRFEV